MWLLSIFRMRVMLFPTSGWCLQLCDQGFAPYCSTPDISAWRKSRTAGRSIAPQISVEGLIHSSQGNICP
jgi:hypothetical protein